MVKLINILDEIKVNKPAQSSIPPELYKLAKNEIIELVKEYINYLYKHMDVDFISSLFFHPDIKPFIINQMVYDNYETQINGEEILVSYDDVNLITQDDIKIYLETNVNLQKYIKQLTVKFYLDEININELLKQFINDLKTNFNFMDFIDDYDKKSIKYLLNDKFFPQEIENFSYKILDLSNNDYVEYIRKNLLSSDIINEIKIGPFVPIIKNNDQLALILKKNNNFKKLLIDAIFDWNTDYYGNNYNHNHVWESVRQGWYNNPIERFTAHNYKDEIMISTDAGFNINDRIYVSMNKIPSAYNTFEVELPPNVFFCWYRFTPA